MNKLNKNEKAILRLGLYVSMPINFHLLFTQSERDVLNTIRHLENVGKGCVSLSLLRLYTGLSTKTIQASIRSLEVLGVISKRAVCKAGTYYTIHYKTLGGMLIKLNNVNNPVERLRIADTFRGKALAKNAGVIKEYTESQFDIDIK